MRRIALLLVVLAASLCITSAARAADPNTAAVGGYFVDLADTAGAENAMQKNISGVFAVPVTPDGEEGKGALSYTGMFKPGYIPPWDRIPVARVRFDLAEPNVGWYDKVRLQTVGSAAAHLAANLMFAQPQLLVYLGVGLICAAMHCNWVETSSQMIAEPALRLWESIGTGPLLSLALAAVFAFLVVYFVRRQTLRIFTTVLTVVLVLVGAMAYFPNVAKVNGAVARFTDEVTAVALGLVAPAMGKDYPEVYNSVSDTKDAAIAVFGASIWETLICNTWAQLEFGTANPADLMATPEELERLESVEAPGIGNLRRIDQMILAYPLGDPRRSAIADILADNSVDHGRHPLTPQTFSGAGKLAAIGAMMLFGITSGIFLIFAVILAGSMIMAQFVLMILMWALPFLVLALLLPDVGWNIGLKVARVGAGALATKIIYGLYLSVVILVAQLIFQSAPGSLAGSMLLLSVLFVTAIIFRKRFLQSSQRLVAQGVTGAHERVQNWNAAKYGLTTKKMLKLLAGEAALDRVGIGKGETGEPGRRGGTTRQTGKSGQGKAQGDGTRGQNRPGGTGGPTREDGGTGPTNAGPADDGPRPGPPPLRPPEAAGAPDNAQGDEDGAQVDTGDPTPRPGTSGEMGRADAEPPPSAGANETPATEPGKGAGPPRLRLPGGNGEGRGAAPQVRRQDPGGIRGTEEHDYPPAAHRGTMPEQSAGQTAARDNPGFMPDRNASKRAGVHPGPQASTGRNARVDDSRVTDAGVVARAPFAPRHLRKRAEPASEKPSPSKPETDEGHEGEDGAAE